MTTNAHSIASQLNSSGLLRTQGLIGGKWQDAYDGKTIKVYNPATGESITDVACMGGRETNDAISSAFDAFKCTKLHIFMNNNIMYSELEAEIGED
ncbi:hypothetical protein TSUD_56440 [Trifolium subterraneum]|uniref:Aldehyde dehydrogenase domain-containing protein n=1 Tax=Trifolium subterraneum TaxID=3900 RepID=A0A2Z6MUU8_TRISU|nr:hypothetical protein TSUD_56440 [Trifolium subterraneum]